MSEQRLARLRERMAETGTDLVAIGPSSNMVYVAGLSPHGDERPVLLLISQSHAGILMPALNADSSRKVTDLPLYPWSDAEGPEAALEKLLDDCGPIASVALDETMRADFALLLLDRLKDVPRSFLYDTVGWLRMQKDESEYAALKDNARINDGAMQAGFAALREGVSELEIGDVIRAYYIAHGATPEFVSVCFGENGAFPHHYTSERRLKRGDAVLIDIGGRKNGYPSDMTRVGFFGEAPEDFAKVAAVLERAVTAAIAAAKPGVPASDVDKAARDVITEAGYGEYFLHRTGHGLGIDIHEPPYITGTSDGKLMEGNVFSIEPGIYLAGRFGVRLEEIVIVRGNRAEVLSELPRTPVRVTG
jgi:Xaa-Pro aminopeptidase